MYIMSYSFLKLNEEMFVKILKVTGFLENTQ